MLDGEKVEVDPLSLKPIDGRTYLFYNVFWGDTLNRWNKKLQKCPNRAWSIKPMAIGPRFFTNNGSVEWRCAHDVSESRFDIDPFPLSIRIRSKVEFRETRISLPRALSSLHTPRLFLNPRNPFFL
jgi:hypothetical protein